MPSSLDTRTKILVAALELFSEDGYKSTTTKAIADKADVNELTLFRHFGTKENLFFSAIEYGIHPEEMEEFLNIEPTEDLAKDLINIAHQLSKNMYKRAAIKKLMLVEAHRELMLARSASQLPLKIKQLLIDYFQNAQDKGLIRDIDTEVAAVVFFSFFFRSLIFRAFLGKDIFLDIDPSVIEKFVDIFLNGIAQRSV